MREWLYGCASYFGTSGDGKRRALPDTNVERETRLWEGATLAVARWPLCLKEKREIPSKIGKSGL
jgi:hypothetical protein